MALNPDQQQRLGQLLQQVAELAEGLSEQPDDLLQLLRQLEHLHRAIQDGPFRSSLPADRNHLFSLLEQMEQSGGWPYIPRLQLRTFMDLLQREAGQADSTVEPREGAASQDNPQLAA